jgi:hypothetical protein
MISRPADNCEMLAAAAYLILALNWLLMLVLPMTAMPLAFAAYLGLSGLVLWAAVRRGSAGRFWGFLFAALLLTMPVWIAGCYRLCERWGVILPGSLGEFIP